MVSSPVTWDVVFLFVRRRSPQEVQGRTEQSFCLMSGAVPCVCGDREALLPLVKVKVVPLFCGRRARFHLTFLESEMVW